MAPRTSRGVLAFAFHALSFLANRSAPFVAAFFAARILGVDGFGHYIGAIGLFTTLMLVVDLGFTVTTINLVAKRRAEGWERQYASALVALGVCLLAGLLMAIVLALFHGAIAELVFASEAMAAPVAAGALYVPGAALFAIATGVMQGMQRYRELAVTGLAGGVLHVLVIVLGAMAGDAETALWAAAAGMSARALLTLCLLARGLNAAVREASRTGVLGELRLLAATAGPASIASLVFAPVNALLLAVVFRHPDGTAEAGAFGVGLQLFTMLVLVPSIVTQYALPDLSATSDPRLRKRRSLLYAALATGSTFLVAAVTVLAGDLLLALLGPDYRGYATVFLVMALAAVASAPQGAFANYLLAAGYDWHRVWTRYVWGAVVVGVMLARGDGTALSAAIAVLAGWITVVPLQLALVVILRRPSRRPAPGGLSD